MGAWLTLTVWVVFPCESCRYATGAHGTGFNNMTLVLAVQYNNTAVQYSSIVMEAKYGVLAYPGDWCRSKQYSFPCAVILSAGFRSLCVFACRKFLGVFKPETLGEKHMQVGSKS